MLSSPRHKTGKALMPKLAEPALQTVSVETSRVRWTICALLFFATTVNYLDRQVLSMLAKTLETSIGWTSIQYGYITGAFQATYAIGLLGTGYLMDRFGTRKGYAIGVTVWSIAAIAHAAAKSAFTFGIARAFLGLGEAANFPACIKTVAEWFPKKERALATGIFNAGTNVGAIIAPLTVPWLAIRFGWQMAFIATGALGFVWLIFWLLMYHKPESHPRISPSELAHIQSDPPDPVGTIAWKRLLPHKETWAFTTAKFLTDPVWWFYLFWLPKYLQEKFGLTLTQIIVPTLVVYNASAVGSILGGWVPLGLIKRGWSLNAARKAVLLSCALCVVPVMYAPHSTNLWLVLALISLATAAHQGWSANLFTTASDMFPRRAVGSVVGIGTTGGAVGGVLIQVITGYVVQNTHSYLPIFLFAGSAYLLALVILHSLTPKLNPVEFA
jgi:ACS family hexuronate transporter-like MFS transporter